MLLCRLLSAACFCLTIAAAESGPDWERAAELRKGDELSKAESVVKKYGSPAGFEQLGPAEKVEFLRGLLELAHIRALKDDVAGSLALLNWAEARDDEFQRATSCVKYAEILLDLAEFERAKAYLKNADEIIEKRVRGDETGIAIGQGGEAADLTAAWRPLRDDSDALKAEIESEEMKQKFGATYGSYVKLRRLQVLVRRSKTPRHQKEALRVADEIIETDPASQFAAAAGYLKGDLLAARLTEKSGKKQIREVKEYLEKFVKKQPEGLYRGEALMLLGKISLEIEWNAKDAEKYYKQALDYFRKAREKRDAVSLYASISDDLKTQTAPTQKPTTLNQWKRIVYHDEDPLKLYNTAEAPIWYIDEQEKNCMFRSGIFEFLNGRFDSARKLWEDAGKLDENLRMLEASGAPNLMKRLRAGCRQGFLVVDAGEQKGVTRDEKLRILFAEFNFLEERFGDALVMWRKLENLPGVSDPARAIAVLGQGDCLRMLPELYGFDRVKRLYDRVAKEKALAATPAAARAWYNTAWLTLQAGTKNREAANGLFEECRKRFPKSKYAEASAFYLVVVNLGSDSGLARRNAESYFRAYPGGIYTDRIKLRLSQPVKPFKNEENSK